MILPNVGHLTVGATQLGTTQLTTPNFEEVTKQKRQTIWPNLTCKMQLTKRIFLLECTVRHRQPAAEPGSSQVHLGHADRELSSVGASKFPRFKMQFTLCQSEKENLECISCGKWDYFCGQMLVCWRDSHLMLGVGVLATCWQLDGLRRVAKITVLRTVELPYAFPASFFRMDLSRMALLCAVHVCSWIFKDERRACK